MIKHELNSQCLKTRLSVTNKEKLRYSINSIGKGFIEGNLTWDEIEVMGGIIDRQAFILANKIVDIGVIDLI